LPNLVLSDDKNGGSKVKLNNISLEVEFYFF
jgi:hypothetical protein